MLVTLTMTVLTPVLFIFSYDLWAFQGRRSEIDTLLSQATADERSLSPRAEGLVNASLQGRTAAHAARHLILDLHVPWITDGMLGWHATSALWWGFTAIHLSRDEQLAIVASRAGMCDGRQGYSSESNARFQKPLSELAPAEMATLVAIAISPSAYCDSPERLGQRRDWLLSRAASGS